MKKFLFIILLVVSLLAGIRPVFAHEAYVLSRQEFQKGLAQNSPNPLGPLLDPSHFKISAIITVCTMLAYFLILIWSVTPWAYSLDKKIKKLRFLGPLLVRLALSSSFFAAAQIDVVLGPELSLAHIPGEPFIRYLLFTLSLMVFLGVFVELAGLIGVIIFIYLTKFYGAYMLTYLNYLGELLVLTFVGSRFISVDGAFFGQKLLFPKFESLKKLEVPIVRIMYGLALIYAGWTIKFQHQILSVWVYNEYHLQDFFHASAQFIAAGAGLSEILIGLFIVLGFAMRFTVIISLFFITLSLVYFQELIWPHLMLYGISLSLIINSGDILTIDHYLIPWVRRLLKWPSDNR